MKKQLCLLFCLTVSSALFGSVILDIGTGILVETAGSVSVKVDNLIETGSGFFIGEITSGPQTGMAEFAGMSLGSSLTGSITRITGDAAGSSAAKATKSARCYTINNTSGCDLSTNMHINRTFSENSKQNSMKGSITGFESVSSNSKTHGSVASLNTIIGVVIPAGCSE